MTLINFSRLLTCSCITPIAWDCDSSYANASASVGVVAEAYGEAYAKLFTSASVSFAADA
jgi:hypothetical protein